MAKGMTMVRTGRLRSTRSGVLAAVLAGAILLPTVGHADPTPVTGRCFLDRGMVPVWTVDPLDVDNSLSWGHTWCNRPYVGWVAERITGQVWLYDAASYAVAGGYIATSLLQSCNECDHPLSANRA